MGIFTYRRSTASMRHFYNWFHLFYGFIERHLHGDLERAIQRHVDPIPRINFKTAREFACGSGLLTRMLATRFAAVVASDQSEGMLRRARRRCDGLSSALSFRRENILHIDVLEKKADWVFVSFALHLFSPREISVVLRAALSCSSEGVMIFDHIRKWQPLTAAAEWVEGSHYDQFIRLDFRMIADEIGASSFVEYQEENICVMIFRP